MPKKRTQACVDRYGFPRVPYVSAPPSLFPPSYCVRRPRCNGSPAAQAYFSLAKHGGARQARAAAIRWLKKMHPLALTAMVKAAGPVLALRPRKGRYGLTGVVLSLPLRSKRYGGTPILRVQRGTEYESVSIVDLGLRRAIQYAVRERLAYIYEHYPLSNLPSEAQWCTYLCWLYETYGADLPDGPPRYPGLTTTSNGQTLRATHTVGGVPKVRSFNVERCGGPAFAYVAAVAWAIRRS